MATALEPKLPPGFVADTPDGLPALPEGFALDATALPPATPRLSPAEARKRATEEFDTAVEMGISLGAAGDVVERTSRGTEIRVSPRAAEGEAKAKILAKKYDLDKPETPWSGLTSIKPPPEFERIYRAYSKLKPKVVSFGEVVTEPERPWMAAWIAAMPKSEGADRVGLAKELLAWESPGLFIGPNARPEDKPTVRMGYIQPPDARSQTIKLR